MNSILCPFCRKQMPVEVGGGINHDTVWRCVPCRVAVLRSAERRAGETNLVHVSDVAIPIKEAPK